MRAADPRYSTPEDDCNRGDVVIPVSDGRELISLKEKLDEAVTGHLSGDYGRNGFLIKG
jgi:hypothetical protein